MRRGIVLRVGWNTMAAGQPVCQALYLTAKGDWSPERERAKELPWREAIAEAFLFHAQGAHAASLPEPEPGAWSPSEVFADLERRGLA